MPISVLEVLGNHPGPHLQYEVNLGQSGHVGK